MLHRRFDSLNGNLSRSRRVDSICEWKQSQAFRISCWMQKRWQAWKSHFLRPALYSPVPPSQLTAAEYLGLRSIMSAMSKSVLSQES